MSETKHTPGPWHTDGLKVICDRGVVARALTPQDGGTFDAMENARLIAAAPELLAAAKLAVLNFERSQASDRFLGDDDHEAWTALANAVAKAEGTYEG